MVLNFLLHYIQSNCCSIGEISNLHSDTCPQPHRGHCIEWVKILQRKLSTGYKRSFWNKPNTRSDFAVRPLPLMSQRIAG